MLSLLYLVIEKDICECQNIGVEFPYALLVYFCLLSGDLFIFSVIVSPLYSYFCVLSFSVPQLHIMSYLKLIHRMSHLLVMVS
jgi:hypothetical protein